MDEKVLYEELTPAEFRTRLAAAPIAYLPLGTLEYHGEHLPFGVDGIVPREFFVQVARRVGGIVLPMMFMGPDSAHADPAGGEPFYGMECYWRLPKESWGKLDGNCYWQLDDHFQAQVCDVLKGLKRVGFKIVVAHGHAPSRSRFAQMAPFWEKDFGLRLMTCDAPEDQPGLLTDHGAWNETSLMLHVRPDLVARDRLPPAEQRRGIWGKAAPEYAEALVGWNTAESVAGRMEAILQKALAEVAHAA